MSTGMLASVSKNFSGPCCIFLCQRRFGRILINEFHERSAIIYVVQHLLQVERDIGIWGTNRNWNNGQPIVQMNGPKAGGGPRFVSADHHAVVALGQVHDGHSWATPQKVDLDKMRRAIANLPSFTQVGHAYAVSKYGFIPGKGDGMRSLQQ